MAQFLLNCTNLTLDQLKHKNLAISISAMVCLLLTIAILCLLNFYRAYKTVLQRFFQYLTIVTLLHLLFISMDIQLELDYSQGPKLCEWLGFIRQWTATMTYFFVFVITVYLIGQIYYKLSSRSMSSTVCIVNNRNIQPLILEVSVVVGVIVIPLTFLWVPFYNDTYGIYATSCWIQKVDTHCNKSIGSIEQIVLTSVLRIIMIIVIISFIILSAIFCRFACHYRDTRRAHLKTIRQTLVLMCFFVLSSLIELTGLVMYTYSAISGRAVDSYSLWLVYDIAMPISQLVIPSGFLVYLCSFRWKTLGRASGEWKTTCRSTMSCTTNSKCICCKSSSDSSSESLREDLIQNLSNDEATAPTSSRVSPPSNTYFSVEYTGCFTNINDKSVDMEVKNYGSIGVSDASL